MIFCKAQVIKMVKGDASYNYMYVVIYALSFVFM